MPPAYRTQYAKPRYPRRLILKNQEYFEISLFFLYTAAPNPYNNTISEVIFMKEIKIKDVLKAIGGEIVFGKDSTKKLKNL